MLWSEAQASRGLDGEKGNRARHEVACLFFSFARIARREMVALLHVVARRAQIGYPTPSPPFLEVCTDALTSEGVLDWKCDVLVEVVDELICC